MKMFIFSAFVVFLSLFAYSQATEQETRVYDASSLNLVTLDNITYYFSSNEKMSWVNAMSYCLAYQLDLASVLSYNEHLSLIDYISIVLKLPESPFYLGANKLSGTNWLWVNGTIMTQNFWDPNEPNQPTNNCMTLTGSYWFDSACSTPNYFICKQNV